MARPGCRGGWLAGGSCSASPPSALSLLLPAWGQQQGGGSSSGDGQTPSSQDPAGKGIFAG